MADPPLNRHINTKLIATLGPASATRARLSELCDAGLDICRLNFSHGDHETHGRALELVRAIAAERGESICVIGDLCGPKIRLGKFAEEPVEIGAGQTTRIVAGDGLCTAEQLTVSYDQLIDEVQVGERMYINDGLVRLVVADREDDALVCRCTVGGELKSHKGVNLPDSRLSTPALTDKDRADLTWALDHDLDYIALSFVRQPEDLYELKQLIKATGRDLPVVIKIEKPQALEHLDELIEQTDAVLVARGDLGVETPLHRVPIVQKDIIARCRRVGVPVIVATQMLESMIHSPMPTRAEVSDVANAVLDQVDAVMLSGETAIGRYPVEAVDTMNRVVSATASYVATQPPCEPDVSWNKHYDRVRAIAHAAVQAARDVGAQLVAAWTATGTTARRLATHRLPMPVIGLTYDERVARRMNLLYGVVPVLVEPMDNPAAMAAAIDDVLLSRGLVEPDALIVVVTSTQPTTPGATDTVLIHRVGPGGTKS